MGRDKREGGRERERELVSSWCLMSTNMVSSKHWQKEKVKK